MTAISEIRRGVSDPAAVSAFYSWLLGVESRSIGNESRLVCSNGPFVIHGNSSKPVSVQFTSDGARFKGVDPDGVPVEVGGGAPSAVEDIGVALDHLRLNCADIGGAVAFYQRLGFTITWSESGDDLAPGPQVSGPQAGPVADATWVHVSCDDGYLSLSQADWIEPGSHLAASGPPRFIHVGFAVTDLEGIVARVEEAGIVYRRGGPPEGKNIYLNDPDGDEGGTNIEVIQYVPDVERSGRRWFTMTN